MRNLTGVGQGSPAVDDSGITDASTGLEDLQHSVENDDPLALCLSAFIAITDRPTSVAALLAGLPLVQGGLTPQLLQRALDRAGYSSRMVKRSIRQINAIYLPVILLMGGRDACILLSCTRRSCRINDPVTGTETTVPISRLSQDYSGICIFARRSAALDLAETEPASRQGGHWFWSAVRKLWPTYSVVVLGAIFINLIALASPLFTMNVYDRVLPNKALPTLWVLAIGMAIALTFDFLLKTLRSWLIDSAGRRADVLLASRIYEHVLGIEMSNKPPTTGSFASHLKEFEQVREFFTSSTIASFTDMAFFGIFLFVIYQVGGVMVAVPAIAAVLMIVLGLVFQLPLRRAAEKNSTETAQRHSLLVESISSLETVKTIRGESHLQAIWESLVGMTARTVERVRQLNTTLANLSSLIQQLVTVAVLVVGAYLFDAGDISTGAIIASVMLASRAVAPLGQFAIVLARSQQSLVSLRSINKIMAMQIERPRGKKFISEPIANCLVQFQNVAFSYPGSGTPAINGINFTIRPGEKVGIIGKIGSGKTTIGRLMTKLYSPQEGAILVNGVDMRQYHPHEIRRVIGLLGQDSELFHGTVRSNILMANSRATDEKLLTACRLAGVDDFVRRHPKGYDMPVGEKGQALSGGQRQAIALARLLIGEPQMIFLDEPSSAIDMASEKVLIEHLKRSMRPDQTIIVSTHRYSMLDLVDRLIVLANGKIAADGPKEQVLEALKRQSATAKA
ncbi:MAG TPA: type I secretion system permease/ATPase [Aestuariivirga sp.]|nr:type I secretion system permease/ATPase [Aestuariivirga sp.]